MIEIKNLVAQNNEKKILKIDDFLFENSSYLISGANGSGKSTLIKILANDIDIDKYQDLKLTGSIFVDGKNILKDISAREKFNKDLCYISQEDEFLTNNVSQEFTVYYNIANGTNISKDSIVSIIRELDIEDLLLKTLSKDSLLDVFKLKINSLSGGQKKVIHIVRELIKNKDAKYLLFDEPLNNLDIRNITSISNLINKISSNKLLIIVSHCKIFPFIKNEFLLIENELRKCNYNCLSCFGNPNKEGYYE